MPWSSDGVSSWIEMEEPIEHPASCKQRGQVFLEYLEFERVPGLAVGSRISFRVHAESHGLEAEDAVLQ